MKYFNIFWILALLLSPACVNKEGNSNEEEARFLFNESAELIIDITKKFNLASDSLSIDSINKIYEKSITEINFSVPSETDLKLTEQENDSLFKLISLMKETKCNKLLQLSFNNSDSINKDSINRLHTIKN